MRERRFGRAFPLARITTRSERPQFAREIRVQHALVGPIERASAAERAIWVMGQRVELGAQGARETGGVRETGATGNEAAGADVLRDANGRALEPGARVAISGFRGETGRIAASRVDGIDAPGGASATAVVEQVEPNAIVVGGIRAELAPTERDRSAGADWGGRRVRVSGVWNPERRVLERAVLRAARSIAAEAQRVSIQGFVSRDGAEGSFRIEDVVVDGGDGAANGAMPAERTRVRVEGVVEGGRVRAHRILVEAEDRGRRDRSGSLEDGSGRSERSGR